MWLAAFTGTKLLPFDAFDANNSRLGLLVSIVDMCCCRRLINSTCTREFNEKEKYNEIFCLFKFWRRIIVCFWCPFDDKGLNFLNHNLTSLVASKTHQPCQSHNYLVLIWIHAFRNYIRIFLVAFIAIILSTSHAFNARSWRCNPYRRIMMYILSSVSLAANYSYNKHHYTATNQNCTSNANGNRNQGTQREIGARSFYNFKV